MQYGESVQRGRTERAAGNGRVRAALAVTSRGLDSCRTRTARQPASSRAAAPPALTDQYRACA